MVLPDRILRVLMGPCVPKQVPHGPYRKGWYLKDRPFSGWQTQDQHFLPFSPPKANRCDFIAEEHSFDRFRPCWKAIMQLNHTFSHFFDLGDKNNQKTEWLSRKQPVWRCQIYPTWADLGRTVPVLGHADP